MATLLAAASAQAQEVVQKALGEGANPESTACTYQFTACDINWCLNASGSLVSLQSTGAVEHIRFYTPPGAAVEGYGLCVNNTLKAYDHACSGSGFGPPTVIAAQTATGMTIRRKTTDGLFPLDQKWSRDNTEHDLTEQMTLKILGPAASSVVLWRLADINIDFTDGADNATGLYDRLDRSNYSIWFRDQVNEWDVVRMSVLTPGTPHGVHVSASTIPESAPASVRFHFPAGVRTPWV